MQKFLNKQTPQSLISQFIKSPKFLNPRFSQFQSLNTPNTSQKNMPTHPNPIINSPKYLNPQIYKYFIHFPQSKNSTNLKSQNFRISQILNPNVPKSPDPPISESPNPPIPQILQYVKSQLSNPSAF